MLRQSASAEQSAARQWGFKGHVVSDCGAISDFFYGHGISPTIEAAAGDGDQDRVRSLLRDGIQHVGGRGADKLLTGAANLTRRVGRMLEARFRLGMFDPPAMVPYAKIPATDYDTPANDELALQMARESVVLLKNDGVLPLDRTKIHKIAVLGFNAIYTNTLLGNYKGDPSHPVTFAEGIATLLERMSMVDSMVAAARWPCASATTTWRVTTTARHKAVEPAKTVDAMIYVGGICAELEREFMNVPFEGFNHGDRTRIELPPMQTELLKRFRRPESRWYLSIAAAARWRCRGRRRIFPRLCRHGIPARKAARRWRKFCSANVNPAGRLPITFYRSTTDLPRFHGLFDGQPHVPLFQRQAAVRLRARVELHAVQIRRRATGQTASRRANDTIHVKLDVSNTGSQGWGRSGAGLFPACEIGDAAAELNRCADFSAYRLRSNRRRTWISRCR